MLPPEVPPGAHLEDVQAVREVPGDVRPGEARRVPRTAAAGEGCVVPRKLPRGRESEALPGEEVGAGLPPQPLSK